MDFRPLVQARLRRSEFVFEFRVFDGHIFEFAGLEYLATFKALDEFRVFIARHDAHTGVLALPCCFSSRELRTAGLAS